MAAIDELFAPRGIEMYVPALARIRADLWRGLGSGTALLLELADYTGLERALALTVGDLEDLAAIVPGHLWHAVTEYAVGHGSIFEHDRRSLIACIAMSRTLTK